jgi:hypothetical protein
MQSNDTLTTTPKSKQFLKFLYAEIENLVDTIQIIIVDYYVKFHWFVAHCCFVRLPNLTLSWIKKLRHKLFGKRLTVRSQGRQIGEDDMRSVGISKDVVRIFATQG